MSTAMPNPNQQPQQPAQPAYPQVPAGYELREKKPWYKKTGCIVSIVLVGLLLLILGSCTAMFGGAINEVDKQMNQERTFTYQVEGDGTVANITYTSNMGDMAQENGVGIPWSKEVTTKGFDLAQLTATNGFDQPGSITCRITYNGEVVSENTASGELASASCSAMTSDLQD